MTVTMSELDRWTLLDFDDAHQALDVRDELHYLANQPVG